MTKHAAKSGEAGDRVEKLLERARDFEGDHQQRDGESEHGVAETFEARHFAAAPAKAARCLSVPCAPACQSVIHAPQLTAWRHQRQTAHSDRLPAYHRVPLT